MITNDRNSIQVSADSRALIRAAIKRSLGWKAYAEEHDCDLGTMTTRDAIFDCCDALDIDICNVIAAGPKDEEEKPRTPRRGSADSAPKPNDTSWPSTVAKIEALAIAQRDAKSIPRSRLWGSQVMTEAERAALDQARADFFRSSTPATAAKLLGAAYDAWNESHLGECDYAREVQLVNSWLLLQAGTAA